MDYVRIINQEHFDPDLGRFQSLAFKNLGGGISIVDEQCARTTSGSLCGHTRKFYQGIHGEPPVFWSVPMDDLPKKASIRQCPSESGDRCHADIVNLTDKEAKRFFIERSAQLSGLRICDGESENLRPLRLEDLPTGEKGVKKA